MFALIDCNCFYVSCERLFDPRLEGVPVAILSGPEGCVVSCSPEMKRLGVSAGDPWFQAKHLPGMEASFALSANFELYGDMSRRVMRALSRFGFPMEIYSIDEAFVKLPESMGPAARAKWAIQAARLCLECGIPVSIGIGRAKTQAKLANVWAKPGLGGSGMADWEGMPSAELQTRLGATPCSAIWGVGPRGVDKLWAIGVESAAQFIKADAELLRKIGTVTLARACLELRGEASLEVESHPATAQSIIRTRTFDDPVPRRQDLALALSHFAAAAAFQLRASGLAASRADIFIATHVMDRFNPARSGVVRIELSEPTDDSLALSSAAVSALDGCYKPGYAYRRAGITLSGLSESAHGRRERGPAREPPRLRLVESFEDIEASLLEAPARRAPEAAPGSKQALLFALDQLNARFGRDSVKIASQLPQSRERVGPTTRLEDVPIVKAQ